MDKEGEREKKREKEILYTYMKEILYTRCKWYHFFFSFPITDIFYYERKGRKSLIFLHTCDVTIQHTN